MDWYGAVWYGIVWYGIASKHFLMHTEILRQRPPGLVVESEVYFAYTVKGGLSPFNFFINYLSIVLFLILVCVRYLCLQLSYQCALFCVYYSQTGSSARLQKL